MVKPIPAKAGITFPATKDPAHLQGNDEVVSVVSNEELFLQ